jgi:hypothetical protein
MNPLVKLILFLHNITQVFMWACVLYTSVKYIQTGSPRCYRDVVYWAQTFQLFEIVPSLLKWTKNNPVQVFTQTFARWCITYFILPAVWADPATEHWVFWCLIPWSAGELTRYPYYMDENPLKEAWGHLRYNVFILNYPTGVFGELICFFSFMWKSQKLPKEMKPLSLFMPNPYNITLDFEFIVQYIFPVLYLMIWPGMYMSVFKQRTKYYSSQKGKKD